MDKSIKPLVALGMIFMLSIGQISCFTTMVASISTPSNKKPLLIDDIWAIGQPDVLSSRKMGDPNTLIFLGSMYSYIVSDGSESMMQISRQLDGSSIMIDPENTMLYLSDLKFWGKIAFTYRPSRPVTGEDASVLAKLGFIRQKRDSTTYAMTVAVKGHQCPRIEVSEKISSSFSVRRKISFYVPSSSMVIPVMSKVVLIPVAIAADVATSPLQLGMAFLLIVMKDKVY